MSPGKLFRLLQATVGRFYRARVMDLAAAIAFNTLLSLAPLVLLLLEAASRLLGTERAREQLVATIGALAGPNAVQSARLVIDLVASTRAGALGTVVSIVVMVSFASAVFLQIRSALNLIWETGPLGFGRAVLERAFSFAYVLAALAAILLAMLIGFAGAVLAPLVGRWIPHASTLWSVLTSAAFAILLAFSVALLFRHGPREKVPLNCVWVGAGMTTVLLLAGNLLIGRVLGANLLVSLYGPAGALVAALLWVYYAAQILLFGACFTRVYAESCQLARVPPAGGGAE